MVSSPSTKDALRGRDIRQPIASLLLGTVAALASMSPSWTEPAGATPATTVRIGSPLWNQTYSGRMQVQAITTNAQQVAYRVDNGPELSLSRNSTTGVWESMTDTTCLTDGYHNVDVVNHGVDSVDATDRAWNIHVENGLRAAAESRSITLSQPASNQHYAGVISVLASGSSVSSVAYSVDGATPVAMAYRSSNRQWVGSLNTSAFSSGAHNVDVIGAAGDGSTVTDRAWSVAFDAAVPAPAAAPSINSSKLFGVNWNGAEFGGNNWPGVLGTNYVYPSDTQRAAYFGMRGMKLVRLPVDWERVQPSAMGPLSSADIAGIQSVLDTAQDAGDRVILDMHSFGRYYGVPLTTADAPKLANAWQQLAAHFRGHPALFGYELMNEPHDLPEGSAGWAALSQAATTAIRSVDTQAYVLVPGYSWQNAYYWPDNNRELNVSDPSNRLLYAAHLYFDADLSGTYANSYDASGAYPSIGTDRVQPFLSWLQTHNAHGMLTEYGVPGNDARWLTVLDSFLSTISASQVIDGGTYWAAGPWWGTYPLSVEPANGVDKPQMSVLSRYPTR